MKVFFYSVDDENNKISYNSEAHYDKNMIIFDDKTYENTKVYLQILNDKVIINRKGMISMNLELAFNKKTKGYYQNEMGLEFEFIADCNYLTISDKRIDASYSMILDGQVLSSHKIWIILR